MSPIITDEAALKISCKPVSIEDGLKIADKLSAALTASKIPGCGLAANQIGIDARVCIIRIPKKDLQGFEYSIETTFVNPILSDLKKPLRFKGEGCLSFPDKVCETLRYQTCKVVDDLQPQGRTITGLAAIAAQHEIDHLNGRTMYNSLFENIKPNQTCPCNSQKSYKVCCRPKVKEI